MDRPLKRRARRHMDHRAIAHQRRVERDRDVIGVESFADMRRDQRVALGERLGQRADGQARLRRQVRQLRHEGTVDEGELAAIDTGEDLARFLGSRLSRRIGWRRQRMGLAQQRAQIGVFPLLDAPMRQPTCVETLESVVAQRRHRALARQVRACRRKGRAQRLLGGSFHCSHVSHYAASPTNSA